MSANREFIEYINELLSPLANIEEGSFFGGFAFKSHSRQFAMIMGNTLYFVVNDSTRPKYQALGMKPFSYATKKGRVEVKKYFSAPEDIFEDQEEFILWAQEAIRVAQS